MEKRGMQGELLRAWREAAGLSQRDAGKRLAQFNTEGRASSQPTWAAWERGEKSPDLFFAFSLERMTNGAIQAQGWAVARALPPDSTTNLFDDEHLRKVV
jgi:transcriptional regulator with XRE-family HTH domain